LGRVKIRPGLFGDVLAICEWLAKENLTVLPRKDVPRPEIGRAIL
jgi:hypothetical protein